MKPHNRKLQLTYNDAPFELPTTSTVQTSNSTTFSPAPPPQTLQQQQFYTHTGFDSSMALTILVLLTALFFMGFFSIYIRKCSNVDRSSSGDFSNSYRQSSRGPPPPANISNRPSRVSASSRTRGLEPQVVKSLPVYCYYHGDVKYQMECAICLGEFEEKETVKMIPICQHVFHLECIDTWLEMHVTCPVCRGTRFLYDKGGGGGYDGGLGLIQERVDQGTSQQEARSAVGNDETSTEVREVEAPGVRSGSCSSLGERMSQQRTTSL